MLKGQLDEWAGTLMPWGAESADCSLLVNDLAIVLERLSQGRNTLRGWSFPHTPADGPLRCAGAQKGIDT
jgi:hypothetical protein